MSDRSGIFAVGNWIVDITKFLDVWPSQDALANILGQEENNGGGAYNLLKDLALLGADFPLEGGGLVGDDAAGREILADCKAHGINADQIQVTTAAPTSYTDVMLVQETGRRTFFHQRGANAHLSPEAIDLDCSRARVFYLGYLLLLDRMDAEHPEHGTQAASLLAAARELGFRTCIDVVSEEGDRFRRLVFPALPHTDICIMNEFEAGRCLGMELRTSDSIDWDQTQAAACELIARGVKEVAVIHFPEGAVGVTRDGEIFRQGSVRMPAERIQGATGAGDAFAAGFLYCLHDSGSLPQALRHGVCAAASCLTAPGTSAGILRMDSALELGESCGFRDVSA